MTDAKMRKALAESGIPLRYRDPAVTLQILQTPNHKALSGWLKGCKDWMDSGGWLEFAYDGPGAMDEFFMAARHVLSLGKAPLVLSLTDLVDILEAHQFTQMADGKNVLMVCGLMGDHPAQPVAQEMIPRVEWALKKWVMSRGAIVFQGDGSLDACRWWTKHFAPMMRTGNPGLTFAE